MQALTKKSKTGRTKADDVLGKIIYPGDCQRNVHHIQTYFQEKTNHQLPGTDSGPFSPVFRGVQVLNRDEEGRERCTACGLCAVACPAEAITMEAAERLPGEEHLYREEKYAVKYEINMLRCIFCGLCEEACPKDAVYLSETMVPSNYNSKTFIYGKTGIADT